jgi:hypothetical protein
MSIGRILSLIVLLLAGLGSLLYGAMFHVVGVEEEKQRDVSVMVPAMPGLGESPAQRGENAETTPPGEVDPFRSPSGAGQENPFESPTPPGMRLEKFTEKYTETNDEPEWVIVREVTIGGVARLANGELKRTYSGKPPALCPS